MKKILRFNFLAITLLLPGLLSATVVYNISFEDSFDDGWALYDNVDPFDPVDTSSFSTTSGVTNGSYSLAVNSPGGWDQILVGNVPWGTHTTVINTLVAGGSLSFDVTVPDGTIPSGGWCEVGIAVNSDAGWDQSWDNVGLISVVGSDKTTITLNAYEAFSNTASMTGSGWLQFNVLLNTNSSAAPTGPIYFDNFVVAEAASVIPEPSTGLLMILGLATLGVLGRRRRNA